MAYTFDKQKRLYFRDGRPVKPDTLRSWVAEVMERARSEMAETTDLFNSGTINRAEWTIRMRTLLVRSHGAVAMLAQGGKEAMDAKAWGRAGQRIRSEVDFLRGFERDIANARAGTDAQILARSQLYANAIHGTYQAGVVARDRAAGVARFRRVLGAPLTEHCSDCPGLAGEYDAGSLIMPGEGSECGPACNCFVEAIESEAVAA
jgi:hypothetical protein